MSSSIAIPKAYMKTPKAVACSSESIYSASPPGSTASSPPRGSQLHSRRPSLLSALPAFLSYLLPLGSMLTGSQGSAISKQESTVINIGEPDGTPRLVSLQVRNKKCPANLDFQITYLSSSQGFAWNPGKRDKSVSPKSELS